MSKAILINANQTLLTVFKYGNQLLFAGDSPVFGKSMTADEVLDEVGDSDKVVRLIRFNTETLASEDITEQLARHWILSEDGSPDGIRLDIMPAFVKNSRAWALWQDDEEAEAPQPVNVYARLEGVYSTLDHRTQGLVAGADMRVGR